MLHLLMHLQRQFCTEIHKFHVPIEVKMNQFKVDANGSIFQCGTKNHKFFFWGLSLNLKKLEKCSSLSVKSFKKSFKSNYTGRSLVLNSGWDVKIWQYFGELIGFTSYIHLKSLEATTKYFLYEWEANFSLRKKHFTFFI